ncbi:MAG: DUF4292 domain-containing protein [Deltaproteobacteria bacterium]|nr:DUF4292 domain-containing protein [Deltaproteobacteria bacterium]
MRSAPAGALLALVLAAGCRPGPVRQPDTTPLPEPETVLTELRAKAGERASLRTMGRVTYFGDKGRVRLKAVLLARRPGAFRVETLSPLEQPVDVMASDGDRLWLLSQDRLRVGAASPENIARLLPLVMGPEAVVDTLLGGVPGPERVKAQSLERGEDDSWRLTVINEYGERVVLKVNPVARRVEAMELLGEGDAVRVRVKFDDFEALPDGGELPKELDIRLLPDGAQVAIRLQSPEINVAMDDALFRIDAPAGVTPEPLDGPG